MINKIKNEFLKFIEDNELIDNGDGIVVGLSGGPDSICLLNLLNSVKKELNLKIVAVHINHMLRGIEADKDEEYARKRCKELNIQFFSKKIDIKKFSRENGVSEETAGRQVRYGYFDEIMSQMKLNKIATAHNANDQAETILMHIMRGTGIEGLLGIPIKRAGRYIRPILFMKREEVEAYCKQVGDTPRIDESNRQRVYGRNKVRLDILPYMKENFNTDIIQAINRMASLLEQDNKYINEQTAIVYGKVCYKKDDAIVLASKCFDYDRAIISRIIRKAISDLSGNKADISMKHIEEVIELKKLGTNKKINLPNNVYGINIYGDIYIKKGNILKENFDEQIVLHKEEIFNKEVLFGNYIFNFEAIQGEQNINFNENNLIKYFNYDNIDNVVIRYRRDGDKMIPIGMSGSKKLKDIFIDMKIPQEERGTIPIVELNSEIAWVVGVKMSNKYKVNKENNNIIRVTVRRRVMNEK